MLHFGLGFRREELRDIHLADLLPERIVHRADRPLPALALLGLAAQGAAVEGEARCIEPLRQIRRMVAQVVEGEIRLQSRQRRALEDGSQVTDCRQLAQDELFTPSQLGGRKERLPFKSRSVGDELGLGARIVGGVHIPALLDRPLCLGHTRLEDHDRLGFRARVRNAAKRQHLFDVGNVLRTNLLELRIVLQVVVAVGEAEARLADDDRVAVRVLQIRRQVDVE